MKKYFAYGMNLNHDEMLWRCPNAVPIGPRLIPGYKMVIRRYADIIQEPLCSVWGGCWKITEGCERQLDRLEGFPSFYKKIEVHGMMTYQMMPDHYSDWKPSLKYMELILEGLSDFGLPPEILMHNLCLDKLDLNKFCEVY